MALPVAAIGVRAIRVAGGLGVAAIDDWFSVASRRVATPTRSARTLIVCGAQDVTPPTIRLLRTSLGSPAATRSGPGMWTPCPRLLLLNLDAQLGSRFGPRLGQELMPLGPTFDRPRLDAVGSIADFVRGDVAEVRVDHLPQQCFVAHGQNTPCRRDLLERGGETQLPW